MTLKDIDKRKKLTFFEKSGQKAEKQMAFYLDIEFKDIEDIVIINDLRIESNGDVAQIDHLIIHRFGFIIIESKSVTTKVSINEFGEWSRTYNGKIKGMSSPTNQAQRQLDFIKRFLVKKNNLFFGERKILKTSITEFKFDFFVAISDDGIIQRSKKIKIPEVLKADQVSSKVAKLIASYKVGFLDVFIKNKDVNYSFKDERFFKIIKFLYDSHKPKINKFLKEVTTKKEPTINLGTFGSKYCKCGSENIKICYGKYSYHFKCSDCKGNTAIKLKCNYLSCKPRIRKQGLNYYKDCESCNMSILYFKNKY